MKRITTIAIALIMVLSATTGLEANAWSRPDKALKGGGVSSIRGVTPFAAPLTAEEAAQLLLEAQTETEIPVHVSPDGDDEGGSGLITAPVRTIDRARQILRVLIPSARKPIRVYLRGGKYFMSDPVVFKPEDSGTEAAPVTYKAFPEETPVLSGAMDLHPTGWKTHRDKVMVADLPGGLSIDQLFVDGKNQIQARYPNYNPSQPLQGSTSQSDIKARSAGWADPIGGYIRAIHSNAWGGNSYLITGKNANAATGLDYTWVGDNNRGAGMENGARSVMVENIFEEVDAPGEWYYDGDLGKLYYYPPADLIPAEATFEGAVSAELVRFEGEKGGSPVQGITLDGLVFSGTKRTLFTGQYIPLMRGDWCVVRSGSVFMRDAEGIQITGSTFEHIGGNAIFISGHNRDHRIEDNEILHVGSTGILIAGLPESVREPSFWNVNVRDGKPMPEADPWYVHKTTIDDQTPGPLSENYPKDIRIARNHIMDVGIYEKQSCGVSMSVAAGVKVLQNTIHESPRAGININDGSFGGHEIAQNDVFDCQKETADHGQFNSWGRDRFWSLGGYDTGGNNGAAKYPVAQLDAVEPVKIHDNRFYHDGKTSTWGIDLDDGSTNYQIYNNLCLQLGIKLREGFNRKVYNNIVIDGQINLHCTMEDSHDLVYQNIVLSGAPYNLAATNESRFAVSRDSFNKNWFYSGGSAPAFPGSWWNGALGYDKNSINTDPAFLNVNSNNYTVTNTEGMADTGFQNFSMTQFGKPGCPWQAPVYIPNQGTGGGSDRIMRETWLGAIVTAIHDDSILTATGTTDYNGVYLESVAAGSLAARYGLKENDIIKTVNGTKLGYKDTFGPVYDKLRPGALVSLGIVRNQIPETIHFSKQDKTTFINDTDTGIRYSTGGGNGWDYTGKAAHATACIEGDLHYNQNGQPDTTWFDYRFTGVNIAYFTRTEDNMGDVRVELLDARGKVVDAEQVSCVSETQTAQAMVYQSPWLPQGQYTLRVSKVSGTYFLLDALRVVDTDETIPLLAAGPVTFTKDGSRMEELQGGETVLITLPLVNHTDDAFSARAAVAISRDDGVWRLEKFTDFPIFLAAGKKATYHFEAKIPAEGYDKVLGLYLYETATVQPLISPAVLKGAGAGAGQGDLTTASETVEFSYSTMQKRGQVATASLAPGSQVLLRVLAGGKTVAIDQRQADAGGGVRFAFGYDWPPETELTLKINDSAGGSRTRFILFDPDVLADKSFLQKLLTEAAGKDRGEYTFTSWKIFEKAYRMARAIHEDPDADQQTVDEGALALKEAMDSLVSAREESTAAGGGNRFTIYKADGTLDGGNRDGTSGPEKDQWMRRPGTNPPQIDATVNGAYAVVQGNFYDFEVLGADKSDSVGSFRVDIDCERNICSGSHTQSLANNRSGTVSLYKKEGLCGGPHEVRLTHSDSRTGRYFEIRQFRYTAAADPVPSIESIAIFSLPEKTRYFTGQSPDLRGAEITVAFEGGDTMVVPVTAELISGFDTQTEGEKTVLVTLGGKTTSFQVYVTARNVTSITLLSPPFKTTCIRGQALNLTGARLRVRFEDDSQEDMALVPSMVAGYDPDQPGTQQLLVHYGGLTAAFEVVVTERILTGIRMETLPTKTSYLKGEGFAAEGGRLRLDWNSGDSQVVDLTADMVSGFDSGFAGNRKVTVTHGGLQTAFYVKISLPDSALLQSLLAEVDRLRPQKENYSFATWKVLESASLLSLQVAEDENRTEEAVTAAATALNEAISGLAAATGGAEESGSFSGASDQVKIYKNTGLLDGGNRDGTSGPDRDQWQRRPGSNPPQTDATVNGAYAVIEGTFTKLALYGAAKESSVHQFKVDVQCDAGLCTGTTTVTNSKILSAMEKIYSREDFCGAHHVIRFIHDGNMGDYLELKRFDYTFQIPSEQHPVIKTIEMRTPPTDPTFPAGSIPNPAGATLTVVFEDETTAFWPVTADMLSGYEGGETGARTITVACQGKTTTWEGTAVAPALTRITVVPPDRAEYLIGDPLDLSGGAVRLHYTGGSEAQIPLEEAMVSGFDATRKGIQVLTVATGGKTATFRVEIRVDTGRRDALFQLYEAAGAFRDQQLENQEQFTIKSWKALEDRLEEAADLLAAEAPKADQMDAAIAGLTSAMEGLKQRAEPFALDILQNTVTLAENEVDPALYTPVTVAPYEEALSAAQAILQDPANATTEETMAAAESLANAMNGLIWKVNRLTLAQYIESAKEILKNEGAYIPSAMTNLKAKLLDAEAVHDAEDADQQTVDEAATRLLNAITAAWKKGDKARLQVLVNLSALYKEANYTPASWTTFGQAISGARSVLENENALQEHIDQAYNQLTAAVKALQRKADFSALNATILVARSIAANLDQYVPSTVIGLAQTLAEAEAVAANLNTPQSQVDAASAALNKKILAARLKADFSNLLEALRVAGDYPSDRYTAASAARLNTALDAACSLLAAPENQAGQDRVDKATEQIYQAVALLTPKNDDKK